MEPAQERFGVKPVLPLKPQFLAGSDVEFHRAEAGESPHATVDLVAACLGLVEFEREHLGQIAHPLEHFPLKPSTSTFRKSGTPKSSNAWSRVTTGTTNMDPVPCPSTQSGRRLDIV